MSRLKWYYHYDIQTMQRMMAFKNHDTNKLWVFETTRRTISELEKVVPEVLEQITG